MAAQQQPWEFLFREACPLCPSTRAAHNNTLHHFASSFSSIMCPPAPLPLQAVAAHERAEKRQVSVRDDCYIVLLHPHTPDSLP